MDIGLLIDGGEVPAVSRATFERRNPVTGEVATRAAAGKAADAARAHACQAYCA